MTEIEKIADRVLNAEYLKFPELKGNDTPDPHKWFESVRNTLADAPVLARAVKDLQADRDRLKEALINLQSYDLGSDPEYIIKQALAGGKEPPME